MEFSHTEKAKAKKSSLVDIKSNDTRMHASAVIGVELEKAE